MIAILFVVACVDPAVHGPDNSGAGAPEGPADTAEGDTADTAGGDTADTADTANPDDQDGDGYLVWSAAADPALADCDDHDPAVNPTTEVYVPAGSFVEGRRGVAYAEPEREVELSAYCIDRTEVTHGAFLLYLQAQEALGYSNVDASGRELYSIDDLVSPDEFPARFTYDAGVWTVDPAFADHPVTEVWEYSGEDYCAWRGKRLPTEAEWEKAARGDDARSWPWGDELPTCDRAAFLLHGAPGQPDLELCYPLTVPVDSLPTNLSPYGAVGLAGNAAEWVSDWFAPEAYASEDAVNPTGPAEGQEFDDGIGTYIARVARGGNYTENADDIRSFMRHPEPEGATSNGVSFRCARGLP